MRSFLFQILCFCLFGQQLLAQAIVSDSVFASLRLYNGMRVDHPEKFYIIINRVNCKGCLSEIMDVLHQEGKRNTYAFVVDVMNMGASEKEIFRYYLVSTFGTKRISIYFLDSIQTKTFTEQIGIKNMRTPILAIFAYQDMIKTMDYTELFETDDGMSRFRKLLSEL